MNQIKKDNKTGPVIAIGGSAGCLNPLIKILDSLSREIEAAIVFANHISPNGKSFLKRILEFRTDLKIKECRDQEFLECSTVHLSLPGKQAIVEGKSLVVEPYTHEIVKSNIDRLFESAAKHYGNRAIGVILSGTLSDGSEGVRAMKNAGATIMIQEPKEAIFSAMPQNAIAKCDDQIFVGTAEKIAEEIIRICADKKCRF